MTMMMMMLMMDDDDDDVDDDDDDDDGAKFGKFSFYKPIMNEVSSKKKFSSKPPIFETSSWIFFR